MTQQNSNEPKQPLILLPHDPLRKILARAYLNRRAVKMMVPLLIAIALSFVPHFPGKVTQLYAKVYPTQEVHARILTSIWVAAALWMSGAFSSATVDNIIKTKEDIPEAMRRRADDMKVFNDHLDHARRHAKRLMKLYYLLIIAALWPSRLQDWGTILSGFPLVAYITWIDHHMRSALRGASGEHDTVFGHTRGAAMRKTLSEAGRLFFFVDVPILLGLIPITALKIYWTFVHTDAPHVYAVGFAGGVIAAHLVLGNLISLLFETVETLNPEFSSPVGG
jgi:hypothetical protein